MNRATIAITRGALLFDLGVGAVESEGPTEGVGDASGSEFATMTSKSGVQSLNPSW